jgi:hypothetical protein
MEKYKSSHFTNLELSLVQETNLALRMANFKLYSFLDRACESNKDLNRDATDLLFLYRLESNKFLSKLPLLP